MSAQKHDDEKPRPELIPFEAINGMARVFGYGARKYAPDNWRKGLSYSRTAGALLRHFWAWWAGEQNDPESGEHHLDHALCSLAMLRATVASGFEQHDDRPRNGVWVCEPSAVDRWGGMETLESARSDPDAFVREERWFLPTPQVPLLDTPRPYGEVRTSQPCPVCGEAWTPFPRSRLNCHAACLFSVEDQIALADQSERRGHDADVARRLGISVPVLRAVIREGIEERKAREEAA